MIGNSEDVLPFVKSWIFYFGWGVVCFVWNWSYDLTDYLTNNWCELKPVSWATRADKYPWWLSHPVYHEITWLCIGIDTFFHSFNPDKVFSKILHGLFAKFLIVEIYCVFNVISIQGLSVLVLGKFYAELLARVARSAVVKFSIFCVMGERRKFSNIKLRLRLNLQKWHKLLNWSKQFFGFRSHFLNPLATCQNNFARPQNLRLGFNTDLFLIFWNRLDKGMLHNCDILAFGR